MSALRRNQSFCVVVLAFIRWRPANADDRWAVVETGRAQRPRRSATGKIAVRDANQLSRKETAPALQWGKDRRASQGTSAAAIGGSSLQPTGGKLKTPAGDFVMAPQTPDGSRRISKRRRGCLAAPLLNGVLKEGQRPQVRLKRGW